MLKLFFSSSPILSLTLFRSRLSQQITAWVFFGIVVIEAVLFVPSYGRRQAEELRKLETVSQEVLTSVKAEIMGDMPEQTILRHVRLREDSVIKGVSLYDADGQLVDSVGEAPAFEASTFTEPAAASFWQVIQGADPSVARTAVRKLGAEGSRYDVAWPSADPQVRYMLAIRHDATAVQRGMRAYALGVMCLVVIISAFVTLVTLSVLQRIVIRPLLLLRDDLAAVRDAIAQGQTPNFASLQKIPRNEMGEVSIAFRNMFEWIHQEICDREEAERGLRLEQEKADRLLLNILPAAIASQLKDNEDNQGAIANRFETATILFADIVKFTEIAANTGPTELVCQLNDIFSAFDAIAERHGLEKIKTIGDAYMVVGGVPSPQANHAEAVLAMAIEMMEFAQSYQLGGQSSGECSRGEPPVGEPYVGEPYVGEPYVGERAEESGRQRQLCLRIGINTGPVVAGVIGTKKFSYDLWGDAVNVASRMESHGIVNRIQVSEDTYLQLKEIYKFEDRGYLHIKGRGEMRAFLLADSKT